MRAGGGQRTPGPPAPVTRRRSVPGMTMEMAGTLMGAAVHGLIVSGAHGPHRCEDVALARPAVVSPDAVSVPAARPLGVASPALPLLQPVPPRPAARSPRFSARAPSQRKATDRRAAGGERDGKGPQAGAGGRGWRPCGARGDTPPVAGPTPASPAACTEKGTPESSCSSSPCKPDLSPAAKSAPLLSSQFSSSSLQQVM